MKKVSQRRARRAFDPERSCFTFADFSEYCDVVLSEVLSLIVFTKEKTFDYPGAIFLIAPWILLDLGFTLFINVEMGYNRVPVLG